MDNRDSMDNMDNRDNIVDIYQLVNLAHIPEINHILRQTVESVDNGPLTEAVRLYQAKVDFYYRTLFQEPVFEEFKRQRPAYPLLYWFELGTFSGGDWGLTKIAPFPKVVDPYETVMPQDVIDQIKDIGVNPDQVVDFKKVYSTTSYRMQDIRAVKLTPMHMCGTVRLNIEEFEDVLANRCMLEKEELEEDVGVAYHAFLYYLHNVPWFAGEFVREFFALSLPASEAVQLER